MINELNDPKVREYLICKGLAAIAVDFDCISASAFDVMSTQEDEMHHNLDGQLWDKIAEALENVGQGRITPRKLFGLILKTEHKAHPQFTPGARVIVREQPAQDVPAEYAALKAKYGDSVVHNVSISRHRDHWYLGIVSDAKDRMPGSIPKWLSNILGISTESIQYTPSGLISEYRLEFRQGTVPRVKASQAGLEMEEYIEYVVLHAYDDLQAAPEPVSIADTMAAAVESYKKRKELQPSQNKISHSQREEFRAALKSHGASQAADDIRYKPCHGPGIIDLPADDYPDDLRNALMLPKGDPIREAAVKVLLARRGKGE